MKVCPTHPRLRSHDLGSSELPFHSSSLSLHTPSKFQPANRIRTLCLTEPSLRRVCDTATRHHHLSDPIPSYQSHLIWLIKHGWKNRNSKCEKCKKSESGQCFFFGRPRCSDPFVSDRVFAFSFTMWLASPTSPLHRADIRKIRRPR